MSNSVVNVHHTNLSLTKVCLLNIKSAQRARADCDRRIAIGEEGLLPVYTEQLQNGITTINHYTPAPELPRMIQMVKYERKFQVYREKVNRYAYNGDKANAEKYRAKSKELALGKYSDLIDELVEMDYLKSGDYKRIMDNMMKNHTSLDNLIECM